MFLKKCTMCGKRQQHTVCDACYQKHYERDVLVTASKKELRKTNSTKILSEEASAQVRRLTKYMWCANKDSRCKSYDGMDIREVAESQDLLHYPQGTANFPFEHWKCPVCKKVKYLADVETTCASY